MESGERGSGVWWAPGPATARHAPRRQSAGGPNIPPDHPPALVWSRRRREGALFLFRPLHSSRRKGRVGWAGARSRFSLSLFSPSLLSPLSIPAQSGPSSSRPSRPPPSFGGCRARWSGCGRTCPFSPTSGGRRGRQSGRPSPCSTRAGEVPPRFRLFRVKERRGDRVS